MPILAIDADGDIWLCEDDDTMIVDYQGEAVDGSDYYMRTRKGETTRLDRVNLNIVREEPFPAELVDACVMWAKHTYSDDASDNEKTERWTRFVTGLTKREGR